MFPLVISIITFLLFLLSKNSLDSVFTNLLLSLSQISSLLGAVLLSFTFILSSRLNFLEKYFGALDKIYKKHHLFGFISFLLLIFHPILLAFQALSRSQPFKNYFIPSNNIAYSSGIIAIYLLIFFLIFTFLIKLPYHTWYFSHQFMGLIIFFVLFHTLFINSDLSRFSPLKIWIIFWLSAALFSYLYKKFFYTKFGPKYRYTVKQIINNNGLLDLYLKSASSPLKFYPGQFVFLSFQQKGINQEFHPFSILSTPSSSDLHFAIKIYSDYTASLMDLQKNSSVVVMGPYGRLYDALKKNQNLIFIAGGIGITPLISLIETEIAAKKNSQMTLFYSNRNLDSAFYHQNFKNLSQKNKNFKYYPVFTDSQAHLSAVELPSQVTDFSSSAFILCGPPAMINSFKDQLLALHIPLKNIYYEDFSLI